MPEPDLAVFHINATAENFPASSQDAKSLIIVLINCPARYYCTPVQLWKTAHILDKQGIHHVDYLQIRGVVTLPANLMAFSFEKIAVGAWIIDSRVPGISNSVGTTHCRQLDHMKALTKGLHRYAPHECTPMLREYYSGHISKLKLSKDWYKDRKCGEKVDSLPYAMDLVCTRTGTPLEPKYHVAPYNILPSPELDIPIFVVSVQGLQHASPINKNRFDQFVQSWTQACGENFKKRVSSAWLMCLEIGFHGLRSIYLPAHHISQ